MGIPAIRAGTAVSNSALCSISAILLLSAPNCKITEVLRPVLDFRNQRGVTLDAREISEPIPLSSNPWYRARMPAPHIQRYRAKIRLTGKVEFGCPFCGHVTRLTIRPPKFRWQCANIGCRRMFTYGFRVYSLEQWMNARIEPPVPEDMIFPEAELSSLPRSKPVFTSSLEQPNVAVAAEH